MDYALIKGVHVACVAVSYALFLLRGALRLARPDRPLARPLRILPHLNDTVLLSAGVALAVITHRVPLQDPWLTTKLVGLVLYILLGLAAFRWARSRRALAAWWSAAQGVFLAIVAVAVVG